MRECRDWTRLPGSINHALGAKVQESLVLLVVRRAGGQKVSNAGIGSMGVQTSRGPCHGSGPFSWQRFAVRDSVKSNAFQHGHAVE